MDYDLDKRLSSKLTSLVELFSSFGCSDTLSLCVISCVGVDGERPTFVVSLHNLELSLPPMSQKGKKVPVVNYQGTE